MRPEVDQQQADQTPAETQQTYRSGLSLARAAEPGRPERVVLEARIALPIPALTRRARPCSERLALLEREVMQALRGTVISTAAPLLLAGMITIGGTGLPPGSERFLVAGIGPIMGLLLILIGSVVMAQQTLLARLRGEDWSYPGISPTLAAGLILASAGNAHGMGDLLTHGLIGTLVISLLSWSVLEADRNQAGSNKGLAEPAPQRPRELLAITRKVTLQRQRAEAREPGGLISFDLWQARDGERRAQEILADPSLNDAQARTRLLEIVDELRALEQRQSGGTR